MVSIKQSILLIAFFLTTTHFAIAKARIPIGEREVVKKVQDLPNTDEFKLDNGNYLDLATLHKEFNIAYILPLYITQDPKIVGYEEKSGIYYNIPETELNKILASQKLNYSVLNKLPFYTKYGGKLVAALIIALLIWGSLPTKKSKVEPKQV